jgi:hypothetical protein
MILMKTELAECQRQIIGLSKPQTVASPLHRLPSKVYDDLWRITVQIGDFTESEIAGIDHYYYFVDQINRGLNQANHAIHSDNKERADKEIGSISMKAKKISLKAGEKNDPYSAALSAVTRHLEKSKRFRKF